MDTGQPSEVASKKRFICVQMLGSCMLSRIHSCSHEFRHGSEVQGDFPCRVYEQWKLVLECNSVGGRALRRVMSGKAPQIIR